jgi:hypothetical protein
MRIEWRAQEILVGAGRDRAGLQRAARLERREPVVVRELLASLEQPVVGEGFGQLLDHGTFEAEMRVAHRMARLGRQQVLVADIDAAHEADLAVDHQNLAMVAQVEERRAPREIGMQEAVDRHAGAAQRHVGARPEPAAAHAVDQHAHLHAAFLGTDQRVDERKARFIGAEDVAAEADALLRGIDRRDHRGIGLVAVAQHVGGVADGRGHAGQPADRIFERRQRIEVDGVGARRRGRHVLRHARPPQPLGAPLHAIDAEAEVQQGAEERRQPRDPHPRDRRADVALVQQDVDGDAGRDSDMRYRGEFADQPGQIGVEDHRTP